MWLPTQDNLKNSLGQIYLKRLFLEQSYTVNDKSNIPYTLRDEDHPEGYRSLYKLYMLTEDPTEFTFATKYLAGHSHWARLCESEWFIPFVVRWREELELKLKAKAMEIVQEVARDNSHKNQFEAVKILLNSGWRERTPSKKGRGRPSKEELQGELKRTANEHHLLQEDLKRVTNYEDDL